MKFVMLTKYDRGFDYTPDDPVINRVVYLRTDEIVSIERDTIKVGVTLESDGELVEYSIVTLASGQTYSVTESPMQCVVRIQEVEKKTGFVPREST